MIKKKEDIERVSKEMAALFISCPFEGIVSYTQLSRICGFNPQDRRHVVAKAIRIANEEAGVVVKPVINVGYQRVSDGVLAGISSLAKARRQVRRGRRTMGNWMKTTNLSDEELKRAYAINTQLSLGDYLLSRKATTDMSAVDLAKYRPSAPDITETLAALGQIRSRARG